MIGVALNHIFAVRLCAVSPPEVQVRQVAPQRQRHERQVLLQLPPAEDQRHLLQPPPVRQVLRSGAIGRARWLPLPGQA